MCIVYRLVNTDQPGNMLQPGAQAGVTQGPGHQGGGFQCGGEIVLFRLWDSGLL